ncbi:hypothetical protein Dimus_038923 [Dionaea muscipula]
MSDNNKDVMISKDNAFVACQAVATSLADDRNHYVHEDEVTINKGWLYRDLKSQAIRVSDISSNCYHLLTPIFNLTLLGLQNVAAIDMAQRLQTNTYQRVAELLNDKRKMEEEREHKEEELTLTKGLLETAQGEANMLREQMLADSRAAQAEQERLNSVLEKTCRVVAELEERQRTEAERIKETHFDAWRETWLDSEDGRAYIDECSRSGIVLGYKQALTHFADRLTDLDDTEKWGGLPNFDDIGFRPNGDPYYLADDEEGEIHEEPAIDPVPQMPIPELPSPTPSMLQEPLTNAGEPLTMEQIQ